MFKKNIIVFAVLLSSGFLLYSGSFKGAFHFDDYGFIVNNQSLRKIGDLSGVWNLMDVPTRFVGLYSFAINYRLHGLNVVGYHVTNTLIHCVTSFLIFWFFQLLLSIPKMQIKLNKRTRNATPFLTALLFLAHPAGTQAVTYISQRFASLATLFYVLSLCFYLRFRLIEGSVGKRIALIFLCILSGLLGMFTKEIVITLPIMIVFLEWFLFGGKFIKQNKIFFIAILAMVLLIPAMFSFQVKSIFLAPRASASHAGDIITYGPYFLTQLRVLTTFLKLFVFPVGLNLDYDFPLSHSPWEGGVLFSAVLLIAMLTAALRFKKDYPLISLGIIWFFITILPNFVPRANIIFEHKMYLVSIGLCVVVVSGIHYFTASNNVRRIILSVVIILLGVLTVQRNKVWENDITLWSDVVKKSPNKFRPNLNMGRAYLDYGQYSLAQEYFKRALAIDPNSEKAYNNLGLVAVHFEKYDEALEHYNRAIAQNPRHPKTYLNRGSLYRKLGKKELALNDYSKALELNPQYSIVYVNRGNIFASEGKFKDAIVDYTKAIDDYVNYEEAFRNRGNAYRFSGELDLALADYHKALAINPNSGATYYYRSLAFYDKKMYDQARQDAKRAVQLRFKVPAKYLKALNAIPQQ